MRWASCVTQRNRGRSSRKSMFSHKKAQNFNKGRSFLSPLCLFVAIPFSQEDDGLQTGDLDAFSASRIAASQHIINTNHIITGSFESYSILFCGMARQGWLLRPANPTNLVLSRLLARRAVDRMRFCFSFLVKEISFLHR